MSLILCSSHFDLQLHVSISQLRECSEILVPYVRHLSKLSIWFGCDHCYWPSHSNFKYFNMLLCTVGSFSICPKLELFQSLLRFWLSPIVNSLEPPWRLFWSKLWFSLYLSLCRMFLGQSCFGIGLYVLQLLICYVLSTSTLINVYSIQDLLFFEDWRVWIGRNLALISLWWLEFEVIGIIPWSRVFDGAFNWALWILLSRRC